MKESRKQKKRYMDTALPPKERAKALLEELSLEEKVAQLNCVCIFSEEGTDPEKIRGLMSCGIGAVSTLELRRMKTLEEAADWQIRVQRAAMDSSPHRIPAMFHMEGLCGAFLQDATSFPAGIGRGASWDPGLEEEIGRVVSRQEKACGITHIFAPVLDISRDSRMGVYRALDRVSRAGAQSGRTPWNDFPAARYFFQPLTADSGIHLSRQSCHWTSWVLLHFAQVYSADKGSGMVL